MSISANSPTKTMSESIAVTWHAYVDAWNAQDQSDRVRFLSQAAVADSNYTDPNVDLEGHEALADYMGEFHQQIPGAQFVLTRFISHHQKSIACWDLRDTSGKTIFTGISYGTYNAQGKLTAEHGFFDTPETE